jgi:hypothetical protein
MLQIAGEIGPRRATSLGEAKAAAYLDGRLRRAGMQVSADPFRAVWPAGWDGLLLALTGLLGAVLYYWLPLLALLLSLWNTALAALLVWRGVPLLGMRRASQNVVATQAAVQAGAWRVVLLAPLDSPPALGGLGRALLLGPRLSAGRLVVCGLLVLLALAGMARLPWEVRQALWYGQLLLAAFLGLLAALEIRASHGPSSPGAVSHAGALAALLAAAEDLGPLDHVELWAVALGATATGAGISDLLRRYPFDRESTLFLCLEGIGAGSLGFVSAGDAGRGRGADPLLLEQAYAAAAEPQVDAGPRVYRGGRTLAGDLRRAGLRTVAITCLDAAGRVPLRASEDDAPDQVDAALLERAAHLAAGIVRRLDTSVA